MKGDTYGADLGKRIVFRDVGLVDVEDFEVPEPKPNEVLVRTVSTLISPGTETAFLMALPNTSGRFPQHPGYSNAGVVISVGDSVSRFKVGDRVVSYREHASHVTVPEEDTQRIPESVPYDEATFFALGSIALQGVRKAGIELGESVLVLGQGLVGLLALQHAGLSGGIPLIAVDLYENRLEASLNLGADYALNPAKIDLEREISEITGGKGVNVVIEATGNPKVIPTALRLAGRFGRVVLLGSPRGLTEVNFYREVHRKGITVVGAHASVRPRYESFKGFWTRRDDTALVLELIKRGKLRVRDLITRKLRFTDAKEAYRMLIESKGETLGIVLEWK
ncbi:MAG: hypothetical protein AYL32_006730 [Candidatus Bathyarchaeota archaeon B26-2]|nr:MAG: hypothetical protein AYL32_006730 [Candidatus Bathyarchaeota archaeon B26-2]